MDEQFIRNRITELRVKKGVSEYRMSMDLGAQQKLYPKHFLWKITAVPAGVSVYLRVSRCRAERFL